MIIAQDRVDTRGRCRRRHSEMLGFQGDVEQLSGLLLLKGAHLVFEHLALEGALTLMLHALQGALLFAEGQHVSLY